MTRSDRVLVASIALVLILAMWWHADRTSDSNRGMRTCLEQVADVDIIHPDC